MHVGETQILHENFGTSNSYNVSGKQIWHDNLEEVIFQYYIYDYCLRIFVKFLKIYHPQIDSKPNINFSDLLWKVKIIHEKMEKDIKISYHYYYILLLNKLPNE